MKLTQLDFHITLIKLVLIFLHVLTEDEKSLLCKGLRFSIPPKKIEYADFLIQFKLLYRDTLFEMKSKNRHFLKTKLKDICFSNLKSYSYDKVEKKLIRSGAYSTKKLNLFGKHKKATQWLLQIVLNI